MSKLHTAMTNAIASAVATEGSLVAQVQAAEKREAEAFNALSRVAGSAVIRITEPTSVIPITNLRNGDHVTRDQLDYVQPEECRSVLFEHAKLGYRLETVCASLIAQYCQDHADRADYASLDAKMFRTFKADCEAWVMGNKPTLKFPAQWEVYFSAVKKAIALGFGSIRLLTLDEDNVQRCVSRPTLLQYVAAHKATTTKATPEERIASQIESMVEIVTNAKGISADQLELTREAKDLLISLVTNVCSSYELAQIGKSQSNADLIQSLIDDGEADNMLKAIERSNLLAA